MIVPLVNPRNPTCVPFTILGLRRSYDAVLSSWNLPYIDFKQLPKLDLTSESLSSWLQPHLFSMYSDREIPLRGTKSDTICNLKEVIHAILSPEHKVLRLKSSTLKSSAIVFFLGEIYLDLNSHSVIREAHVLSVTAETSHLVAKEGLIATQITLAEVDMSLWRRGLSALSERCRDWEHTSTCEYQGNSDKQGLCSYRKGQTGTGFPESLKDFEPHVTRVAISTLFCAPYLQPTRQFHKIYSEGKVDKQSFKGFGPITDGEVGEGVPGKCKVCSKECRTFCNKCKGVAYCSKECLGERLEGA